MEFPISKIANQHDLTASPTNQSIYAYNHSGGEICQRPVQKVHLHDSGNYNKSKQRIKAPYFELTVLLPMWYTIDGWGAYSYKHREFNACELEFYMLCLDHMPWAANTRKLPTNEQTPIYTIGCLGIKSQPCKSGSKRQNLCTEMDTYRCPYRGPM